MPNDVRHEDVEHRAYELYEGRGREDGRDWEDWLQAEREIRGEEARPDSTDAAEPGSERRRADKRGELVARR